MQRVCRGVRPTVLLHCYVNVALCCCKCKRAYDLSDKVLFVAMQRQALHLSEQRHVQQYVVAATPISTAYCCATDGTPIVAEHVYKCVHTCMCVNVWCACVCSVTCDVLPFLPGSKHLTLGKLGWSLTDPSQPRAHLGWSYAWRR